MSTNAILRRTIKALCAPAVMATLAWHAPNVHAEIIARDGLYNLGDLRTFSVNIADRNNRGFLRENGDDIGPLVDNAERPVQLIDARIVPFNNEGPPILDASVARNHNCLVITVDAPAGQSGGGSSSFTVAYTVTDRDADTASGRITFNEFFGDDFTPSTSQECADPEFTSSRAVDDSASTAANTSVEINVLENDSISYDDGPVLLVSGLRNGARVSVNSGSGAPTLTYTPAPGFSGTDTFNYTIQDYAAKGFEQLNSSASVTVTVAPADPAIITVNNNVVENGSNLAVADSDFAVGETVTFDGSSTMFIGEGPRSFQWFVGDSETVQGTDPTFSPRLPDGASRVRLQVTANFGEGGVFTARSAITVTVAPADTGSQATILVNNAPVSNGAFSLTDSDGKPGETPTFDGSQSVLPGGAPTSFQWFVGNSETPQGMDAIFKPSLPDGGPTTVRLVVSNGQFSASSAVAVTVNGVATLANIPGLTANQRQVALALDNICAQLEQNFAQSPASLTVDQQDLRERCQGILAADAASQRIALDELGAQDFNGARLQTLLFTNSLYAGVQDRLMALRGGAKGISLAGLNIIVDGKSVPLAQLQEMAGQLLGGGAAADGEPGSLLGDKWGAWSRGNFTFGEKDRSRNDKGFEADQFSLTAGLDYRLTDKMVVGGALAYGSSNLDYNPSKEGGLDTTNWAVSIYGSSYAGKNFYVDALINAATSNYEADRRITYNDAFGTVQRQAKGDTDGLTLSGGLSGGYDILYKGLTITPALGVFYVDSTIDGFREKRSGGLNLIYDEQSFQSLTGTLGLRVNYAWSLSWGVLVPYFRGDYVREFNEDVEAFNVHFANDPKSPANTIIVKSDAPDQSYVRLVGGLSGQFPFGISGYVEYQRLQGFEFVNFNDLSMGLRVQYRY